MRLIWDQPEIVSAWVAARIPEMAGTEGFGPCQAAAVVGSDGQMLGGVVFTHYQPKYGAIDLSFASESRRWLTRWNITQMMRYPFGQLQCQRVTTFTPRRNREARRFLDAFGFKREGSVRRGFGDDNAIISGLLREEWEASRFNLDANPRPRLSPRNHASDAATLTA